METQQIHGTYGWFWNSKCIFISPYSIYYLSFIIIVTLTHEFYTSNEQLLWDRGSIKEQMKNHSECWSKDLQQKPNNFSCQLASFKIQKKLLLT